MNHDFNAHTNLSGGGNAAHDLNLETIQQGNRAAAYHYSRNTTTASSIPNPPPGATAATTRHHILPAQSSSPSSGPVHPPHHFTNPQPQHQYFQHMMTNTRAWTPLNLDMAAAASNGNQQQRGPPDSPDGLKTSPPMSQSSSPHSQHSSIQHSPFSASPTNPLTDWALQQHQHIAAHQQQHQQMAPADMSHFMQDPAVMGFQNFPGQFHPNPMDYLPPTTTAALQASLLGPAFSTMHSGLEEANMQWGNPGMENWQEFQANLQAEGMPRMDSSVGSNSPTGTYLEVLSLPSSSGEGWAMVDWGNPEFQASGAAAAIFNPSQTLHLRTNSDSSEGDNAIEFGSFEEIPPFAFSPFSNESEGHDHRHCYSGTGHTHHHEERTGPSSAAVPVAVKTETSTRNSPTSGPGSVSPPSSSAGPRRNSGPRRSPISKPAAKNVVRRISNGKKDGTMTVEKKVGRRKGPLLPEQRKQASEIRKLRACLRCKFLKKTCDKGEPCAGCQPSHARLWQVPCTRIDIKDIGYFMKDWKADTERHMNTGVSVYNVKGFAQKETLVWITHGYGFALPVMVREVYVADDSCFDADWTESHIQDQPPINFETRTEKLSVGVEGVCIEALSEYLDKHIEGPFEDFIDDHFEGTPFITEILKTAHRYYVKEKMPVIRKALKLVLAYNLTMHITMIETPDETKMDGQIDDEESKFYGRTVAPVMINFQIKCAMAEMWRDLQKDILEELSSLYSGVYSGEKMKNWPTIFMLASILLAVWEEMQFDCNYRVPDPDAVNKFCNDMETTPVGVIVGLFHAISQKLPAFIDWDTRKHGHLLHNNTAVCEAMTEVRQHVIKHESYLRTRKDAEFDRHDFDSLSNKFLSKLVIRAN